MGLSARFIAEICCRLPSRLKLFCANPLAMSKFLINPVGPLAKRASVRPMISPIKLLLFKLRPAGICATNPVGITPDAKLGIVFTAFTMLGSTPGVANKLCAAPLREPTLVNVVNWVFMPEAMSNPRPPDKPAAATAKIGVHILHILVFS